MNMPIRHGSGGNSGPRIQNISFKTDDLVELNLGISEGPIAGLIQGPRTFFLGDTPLMSKAGTANFNPFELHFFHGADMASKVENVLGGIVGNTQVGATLSHEVPIVRETPASSRDVTDALEVRIYVQNLQRGNAEGDQLYHTATIDIEYRQVGDVNWLPFVGDTAGVEITGRIQGSVKEYRRKVPRISTDWEIRVTLRGAEPDQYTYEDFTWESFQTVTKGSKSYDNLAVVRALSSASEQLSSIPTLSGVYGGMILKVPSNYNPVTRHYDGVWDGTFKDAYTDNNAWFLYNLLTNTRWGVKSYFPHLQVDRFSFYTAAQWCDELVPRPAGGYQPRYTYNDFIQEERSGLDLLHYVASTFGGVLTEDAGGTVVVKVDRPGVSKQIFGPESVSEEGFAYQYTDVEARPNVMMVSFVNPNLGWEKDVREVKLQPFIDKHGRNVEEFTAVGCNDAFEAQRRAQMRLLHTNTETCMVTFSTARQAIVVEAFDIIGIVDPNQLWGLSGRIKSVNGNTIYLRDALTVPASTALTLSVQAPSGVYELTVSSPTTTTTELTIVSGSLPADLPDRAQFSLTDDGSSLGLVKPFRVLSVAENEQDPEFSTITAVEINTNKYGDADNMTFTEEPDYAADAPTLEALFDSIQISSGTEHLVKHKDGTIESRIHVQWHKLARARVEVLYRRLGRDNWRKISTNDDEVYIPNARDGQDYEILLQGYVKNMELPLRTRTFLHTVVGKTTAPAAPLNIVVSSALGGVQVSWAKNDEIDFDHYDVIETSVGTFVPDTGTSPSFAIDANTFTRSGLSEGETRYYFVRAVDSTGNVSPWSAQQAVSALALEDLKAVPESPLTLTLSSSLVSDGVAKVVASWGAVADSSGYELGITLTGGNEVYIPSSGTAYEFETSPGLEYTIRVRALNLVGGTSVWTTTQVITAAVDSAPPAVPQNLAATAGFNAIWLEWDAVGDSDLSHYQVCVKATNATPPANPTAQVFDSASTSFVHSGLSDAITKYYWVRAVDTSGNKSNWSLVASATTNDPALTQITTADIQGAVDSTSFASGLTGVGVVSSLPADNSEFDVVVLTTDGKLYRWNGSAWTVAVETSDLSGQISSSQIIDGAINKTKFASGLTPVEIVSALPSSGNFEGRQVSLTTDGKLYRYHSGAWSKAVEAGDVTGQLTDAQLAEISAAKLVGQIVSNQINSIDSAKLTGTIDEARITALAASKVTGQLSDTQIAAVSAAKVTGQLVADQIADGVSLKDQAVFTMDADMAHSFNEHFGTATFDGTDKYSGTHAALVTYTNTVDPTPGADTDSVSITIPDMIALRFAGKRIRVSGYAKQPSTNATAEFAVSYSTSDVGNSGWNRFTPTAVWQKFEFFYDVPLPTYGGVDYLGFWSDTSNTSLSVLLDQWSIEIVEDLPNLNGQVTGTQIEDDAISTPKLQANAVTAGIIAANAVIADKIAAGAIVADKIAANAITSDKILANAITTAKLAAGAVTASEIAAGTITANEIASNAITTAKLAAGAVTAAEIATGAISADKIAADAITASKIAANSIQTSHIVAGAITAAEIAAGAVTASEIAAGAVVADKIASNAITTAKLAAGAVTADKITANTITAAQIASGTLTAAQIKAGSLDARVMDGRIISTMKASGALVPSVNLSGNTTVYYGVLEDDTAIFLNGNIKIDELTSGASGTFTTAVGDVITSTKPVALSYANGVTPVPLSWADTKFTFYTSRTLPHTVYAYAPYGAGDVTVTNLNTSTVVGTSLVTKGSYTTIVINEEGSFLVEATTPIVAAKHAASPGNDAFALSPLGKEVLSKGSAGSISVDGGAITSVGNIYYYSDSLFSNTSIGDGDGLNAEQGLPLDALGDEYLVGHDLSDYRIAAVNPVTVVVEYFNGTNWTPYKTHDLTAASKSNPMEHQEGNVAGDAIILVTGPVRFSGDAPFFLRVNSQPDKDEYQVVGWRKEHRDSYRESAALLDYWRSTGKSSLNGGVIAANTIIGDKIVAGAISTDHLQADAITAAKIAADAITTGAIAAGAIKADQLDVNAVTASKLAISDLSNLWVDDYHEDSAYVQLSSGAHGSTTVQYISTANAAYLSPKIVRVSASSGQTGVTEAGTIFPVDESGEHFWYDVVGDIENGKTGRLRLQLMVSSEPDFSTGNGWYLATAIEQNGPTHVTGSIEIPAGYKYGKIRLIKDSAGDNTVANFGRIIFRRKAGGELIVDGAITATHVGTNQIIANTANIKNGVITNAKIADLSAAKITAGTTMSGSVIVSGEALSDTTSRASDPGARINTYASATKIDPGKITVSGGTTLSDWRKGGDLTKIDGGAISANTITANKLTIGNRGVTAEGLDFTTDGDTLSWSAGGVIRYIDDNGSYAYANPTAGSVGWAGSRLFIYWPKGNNALLSTTNAATAHGENNVVFAIYEGGSNVTTQLGRTIIDGDYIKTGTITATHVGANQIITNTANIQNGVITNAKIADLDASKITTGSLTAARINLDGLTLENNAGQLQIKSGGVSTTQLSNNAVSVVGANTKGADEDISNTPNVWTQVLWSGNKTWGGGKPLLIMGSIFVTVATGAEYISYRLLVNDVVVYTSKSFVVSGVNSLPISVAYQDTSVAGSNAVKLEMTKTVGGGATTTVKSGSTLAAFELKK